MIRLHANDTVVVVAAEDPSPGAFLPVENIFAKERVSPGHKVRNSSNKLSTLTGDKTSFVYYQDPSVNYSGKAV